MMPLHFNLEGEPNRYGNKIESIILLAVSALFPSLNTLFTLKYAQHDRGLTLSLTIIFLLSIGIFFLIVKQIIQAI